MTTINLHRFEVLQDRRGKYDGRRFWYVWASTAIDAWECVRSVDPLSVLHRTVLAGNTFVYEPTM